jgi:DNA-directed RNA polymerase subunit RPC12/RpoP
MPIEFSCTSCGAAQKANDHLAGRELRCNKCGGRFTVPVTGNSSAVVLAEKPFRQVVEFDESSVVDL